MQSSVGEVVTLLFRRRWVIILVTLTVAGAGAAYLRLATPYYRSEASIVVRFDERSIPDTNMARDSSPFITEQNDRHETVLAHSDILSSPSLARDVVESMGLDRIYPDIVEGPPALGTPLDEAVRVFKKNLVVDPESQGDVINVSFMHPNPALAQEILSRLIERYMQREGEIFSGSELAFQQQQLADAAKRLAAAQVALRAFKEAGAVSSFQDQVSALIQQRTDTTGSLQSTQIALEQANRQRDELQRLLQKVPMTVTNSASGEKYHSIDDAQSKLSELQQKEKEMLATYHADSPILLQLRASIAAAQIDVARRRTDINARDSTAPNVVYQNIQTDLLRATANAISDQASVMLLKDQVDKLDRQLADLEGRRNGLSDLTRAVDIADSAYRNLALHLEDSRVAASRLREGISHGALITNPTLPYKSAKPRYLIEAVAFAIAAVLAGLGAAVVVEYMDDRIRSPHHVVEVLQVPLLATFSKPK